MNDIEIDFGAITIDTNILKKWGYQFDKGILNQMVQFLNEPIRVIQTDIVHQEAKRHIADEVNKSRIAIKKGLRLALNQLEIDNNNVATATQLLSVSGEDADVAEEKLNKYYERIGAGILKTDEYIDFKRLMEMYFNTEAPFEKKESKKNEFPDAIALISLERWAEKNDVKVIAVSADKGWMNFAKNSKRIIVFNDLAEAIEELQPETKVSRIVTIIHEKEILVKENHIFDKITQAIIESLENSDVYIDASSDYCYEQTDCYITYGSHAFTLNREGIIDIDVVMAKDNIIVFQVNADIECEISTSFDFYVRDGIDHDDVGIGSSTVIVEKKFNTDILISLSGNLEDDIDNIDVDEIEVLSTIDNIDLEFIGPDWGYDEDE